MGWLTGLQEDASKILGKDADYPPERPVMLKLQENYQTAFDKFDDLRSKLEDAIQDFENANKAFENGLKANRAAYDKADFGLDPKKKDDQKKIAQASKIFSDFFDRIQTRINDRYKEIDELNKHAIQLRKYKGPAS